MKNVLTISLLSATMLAGQAFAAPSTIGEMPDYPANVMVKSNAPAKTRAEVVAELQATPVTGTELGDMPDYPQAYQHASAAPAKTRAEVRAELNQAVADGTMLSSGIDYPGAF
ncbi:DUF4148 domain-containing protein [Achromobacter sp. GG226]|uniref:DUF4148 domain-containing protein n=1 Tax=Verticiella alkaliphila TaxID=2779529 RepID=UPI001C0B7557|nr:DUF4148 domain-containing protein [Verticiella sp. GG226]MBU4610217.1 DUF4148 domain-containing protein [Verticiella sp. GG226]